MTTGTLEDQEFNTKSRTLRPFLGAAHKWVGLVLAGFLVLTGLTGAVISWDHELDALLNPHLLSVSDTGTAKPALDIVSDVERRYPQVNITYVPLAAEPGHSLVFGVEPKFDPTTKQFHDVGFNQVFINPVDGSELGKREWGAVWPVTSENFVSFLYKLHYSLHLPAIGGTDQWGVWLLGVAALFWTLDCFVGFALTLPARRRNARSVEVNDGHGAVVLVRRSFWSRWKPSWMVRLGAGWYRVNFDLHRAAGLWTWGLLFVIAFTGFSMNLYREVFFPVMSLVSDVTPSPFEQREPAPYDAPLYPQKTYADAIALARAEAEQRGWQKPAGDAFYSTAYGIYAVRFYHPEDDHGAGGVGHPALYFDGNDGRLLGDRLPWQGTAADLFVQAQFPLHSGRILGLPGRILISLMGVVVAGLSVTGVVIWLKKRKARAEQLERRAASRQRHWTPLES